MSSVHSKGSGGPPKKMPWKLSLFGLLLLVFLAVATYPVRIYRDTIKHFNDFSAHSGVDDQMRMREDMERIKEDHERFKSVKLQWLADKYIFSDNIYREAELKLLEGEYDFVIARMEGAEDRRAHFLKYLAHFYAQRELYRSGKKDLALDAVLKETSRMAEAALQAAAPNPNPIDAYNYDLFTNPSAAQRALEGKGPPTKYKLGPEPGKKPGNGEDELGPDRMGGNGKQKRKG